jgi:4-amino-4-deoxy-L-arabinose transferase-like glycosyltransferase
MIIRRTQLILLAILLFSLSIRIPALFVPHIENDEVIYQTLADKVSKNPLDYTLRNTPILQNLPTMNYDQPLFHRPPLFVYLLAIFRGLLGDWGVLLPILAAVFTIVALFYIVRGLYDEKVALISVTILSFCPLLLFCSTRILIDSLLVLFVTLTVWSFLVAIRRRRKLFFALAGLIFGLTILTKEAGMLIVFTCGYLLFKDGINIEKIIYLLYFLGCAILAVFPWYYWFFKVYGTIFPWWAKIFPENIEMFPFMKMVVNRPWYFYFQNITLSMPVNILAWMNIILNLKRKRMFTEILWVFSFLIPVTLYGMLGQGYQTRYILPAVPALAILSADLINRKDEWVWRIGIFLLAGGFLTGILNTFIFHPADIFPLGYFFNLF